MATENVAMYSKKQYELEQIKDGIIAYFDRSKQDPISLKQSIVHPLAEGKTLLLVFEKAYIHISLLPRPKTHRYRVCLVIQLTEFDGQQYADIIASGGIEGISPINPEQLLTDAGEIALKNLGFVAKNI